MIHKDLGDGGSGGGGGAHQQHWTRMVVQGMVETPGGGGAGEGSLANTGNRWWRRINK